MSVAQWKDGRWLVKYKSDDKWVDGRGQFLRDKYAEDLNRNDLELMRNTMRKVGE